MRAVVRHAIVLCLAGAAAAHAADTFPTRAVRIVVPFPAGGPSDLLSRMQID